MKEKIEVWNIFHDGSIVNIQGSLPDLVLTIEILYLRHMFSKDGESILVRLRNCSIFEYQDFDSNTQISNFSEVATLEPEILSVQEIDGLAQILCVSGNLRIKYKDISFELDNGSSVDIPELDKACNEYWDKWSTGHYRD
jgi:hypothetical protein